MHHPSSNQTNPKQIYNLWLLDGTGRMLSHDSLADEIILQPFEAQQLPGLALCLSEALSTHEGSTPLKAYFHKRISLPFPLPECEVITTSHGLITLRNAETNHHWLTTIADKNLLDFTTAHSEKAHNFLPLTLESFRGLARLMDQSQAKIRAVNQQLTGPTLFSSETPYHIFIGEHAINLTHNLAELTRLGQLSAGREDVITLQKDDDPSLAYSFIIRISA